MTTTKDVPSFKALDAKMQKGYRLLDSRDEAGACRLWLEVWSDVLSIFDKTDIRSVEEFDDKFQGTQCLFNWLSDLEMALWNAGLENNDFLTSRIAFCEEMLRRFGDNEAVGKDLRSESARRAIAECYWRFGQKDKVNVLYEEWLAKDPLWGWGWIGWSDCYFFGEPSHEDLERSEQILSKGLAVEGVRDRLDIMERLLGVYEEGGKDQQARELSKEIGDLEGAPGTIKDPFLRDILSACIIVKEPLLISGKDKNLAGSKKGATIVGRKEPCPCGSGRKYKRCCGG
jgi:hypothetical protein